MSCGYLTTEGFIVPLDLLKQSFGSKYNSFLSKLTITHFQKIGPPKQAYMYKKVLRGGITCMQLPRTLIRVFLDNKILSDVEILLPVIKPIDVRLFIELFENQQIIVKYLLDNVFVHKRMIAGTATCIFNLKAGQGKTFVAGGIIACARMRTLYIVPKRPLMIQAVKDLRACLYPDDDKPTINIGQYGNIKKRDPRTDPRNQDVTVIVINSALLLSADFFRGYNLVILDEVHSYCSDQRKEIFRKASLNMCLGMSATTEDRTDGFDPIAHKELAFDGIIRAENIPGFKYEEVDFITDVKVIRYKGPPEFTQTLTHDSTGKIFTPYMNKQFLRDPMRMQLVIKELRELYDWKDDKGNQHCIYVFSEERDALKDVYRELKKSFEYVDAPELRIQLGDNDVGEFIGGIKDAEITTMRENARILLTTYGYSGTGVSIDKMTAILFLTPRRANMKQILARILRRGGNKDIRRKVIDIVDDKTPIKYQYGSRLIAYEFYNMEVCKSCVSL